MRWADIDDDWWTVTTAKNGMNHRVPLSPQTLQILRGAPRRGENVFCAPKAPEGPLRGYRKAFKRAGALAGVVAARPHDLRRTAASMMTSMGVSRIVVGHILNHAERGVTAVYDRYSYDAEKRAAVRSPSRICKVTGCLIAVDRRPAGSFVQLITSDPDRADSRAALVHDADRPFAFGPKAAI